MRHRHNDAARSLAGDEEMRGNVKIHSPSLFMITFIRSLLRFFLQSHICCIDRHDDGEDGLVNILEIFPTDNPLICRDFTQLIVLIRDMRQLTFRRLTSTIVDVPHR